MSRRTRRQHQDAGTTRAGYDPGPVGYWTQGWYTTWNAIVNAATLGRRLFLEGSRTGRHWHNWTHGERGPTDDKMAPRTEAEIIDRVLNRPRIRVVGSGHSFNSAVRSDALMSLDNYVGVIDDFDHEAETPEPVLATIGSDETLVRVRAGMRIRDVNRELLRRGLAIAALPSHDAQSVAGILSTDVHGTGREIGFVSASVIGLRVVDGTGTVHDVWQDDPLFCAAIGGIGAVGVITEVSLRCVDAFNICQRSFHQSVDETRQNWTELIEANEHISLFVFPFAAKLQVHTWNRTDERRSRFATVREFKSITAAALGAAWIGNAVAETKLLTKLVNLGPRFQPDTNLVMHSAAGFNRTIYPMHQELEFAAPIDQTWAVIDRLNEIYESMYRHQRLPLTLLEVRFTPANGTRSLISPGAGPHAHVWVTIVCNQSRGFDDYFRAVEDYLLGTDARPHLGKWCERYGSDEIARVHGDRFERFVQLVRAHDPDGRFRNDFTDQLFASGSFDMQETAC